MNHALEEIPGFEWQSVIPTHLRPMHEAIYKQYLSMGMATKEALARADGWVDWKLNNQVKVQFDSSVSGYFRCPYCKTSGRRNRANQRTCGHPDCMAQHQGNPHRRRA